jgi:hypothetical protein
MADIEHKNIDAANLHPQVRYAQSGAPSSGMNALDLWFDTDDNVLYIYHSSAWKAVLPPAARIPAFPNWTAGRWYTQGYMLPGDPSTAQHEVLANAVYAVPIFNPSDVTLSYLGIHTQYANGSGEFARLGIYDVASDGLPGARRLDAGTVATDNTAGAKTISVSHALPAGRYWLAMKVSATLWCKALGGGTVIPLGGTSIDAVGGGYCLSGSDSGTGLPSTFPGSPTYVHGGPLIGAQP